MAKLVDETQVCVSNYVVCNSITDHKPIPIKNYETIIFKQVYYRLVDITQYCMMININGLADYH